MTATTPVASAPAGARRRNGLGIAALVLVLVAIGAPILTWILVAVLGSANASSPDDAVWVGAIGGAIIAFGLASVLSPVAILGVVLGIASLFLRGRAKTTGVLAIGLGVLPSLFVAGLPLVLGEVVPT